MATKRLDLSRLNFDPPQARRGGFVRLICDQLGQLLLPQSCVICRLPLTDPICEICAEKIKQISAIPSCPRCGYPRGPHLSAAGDCAECRGNYLRYEGVQAVGAYEAELRTLLQAYKFQRQTHIEGYLCSLLLRRFTAAPWRNEIDCFVAVPAHWSTRWGRLIPAERLCRRLARQTGLPQLFPIERVRSGTQVGLGVTARKRNVRGVYILKQRSDLAGRSICVIDDVMTSGATLDEVAGVLRAGGVERIYNLTFARAALH